MHSELQLRYEFNDNKQLAQCVIDRFEQVVIFLPLSCNTHPTVDLLKPDSALTLGTKVLISLKLPDAPQYAPNVRAVVRCVITSPSLNNDAVWVGISISDDSELDIEQRIRRLTHANSHEYGRILAQVFA